MLGDKIDDTLTDLGFEALYRLAEFHEKQATIVRARAYKLQGYQHMENEVARQVEFYKNSHKIVARYIKQGHDIDRAIERAADHAGIKAATVRNWWRKFLDDKSNKAVRQRNALAWEMHCLGVSNVAIADRLNLHPVTVSRILTKERNRRIYHHNPEGLQLFPASRREIIGVSGETSSSPRRKDRSF